MSVTPTIPPYFDRLIPAVRAGQGGRCVHLGLWDRPPAPRELAEPHAFARAQARLNDHLIALADLNDGLRVLDVGCGFGATLMAIDARWSGLDMTGVNIDARQLALCRELAPRAANRLHWLQADALALPLADGSVDRLLCVEAMFHFGSRRDFMHEAARVLTPGGVIVASDIVALPGAGDDDVVQSDIVAGFGPWPDLWGADADPHTIAASAGLICTRHIDATAATLPSHAFTAPPTGVRPRDPVGRATAALAALHQSGRLRYPLLRFERAAA
jgi:SAM-dependent methyltransferase